MSKFTDIEISEIKSNMNRKFDRALIFTLILSPFVCLVSPYIPRRKGRGPMIEIMTYWDSVLKFSIIWILALIAIWLINYYRSEKQFSQNRKYLRKKKVEGKVIEMTNSFINFLENRITINIEETGELTLPKALSENLNIGDIIQVEIEEQTKTILNVESRNSIQETTHKSYSAL